MEKNGQAKAHTNGSAIPAGFVHTPKPSKEKRAELKKEMRDAALPPAPPVDPLAFIDELPGKIRAAIEAARNEAHQDGSHRYAEGVLRASRLIAIAVGQLDGESKKRIEAVLDQLELEADKAAKVIRG